MNHISKTHQCFSERLNNPRVLTNPEDFLGENYKEVLNFWLICDNLTKEQLKILGQRVDNFYLLNANKWEKAAVDAYKASEETIGRRLTIYVSSATIIHCQQNVGFDNVPIDDASNELIGMHLILDENKPLAFFEMVLESYEYHL